MRLYEVLEPELNDTSDENLPTFTVAVGGRYIFTPLTVKSTDGELHMLLTVYSPTEDEIKTYSIQGTDPIVFQVIRSDFPVEDDRIVRVQILSDVDALVYKYDAENDELTTDFLGDPVALKIKQLPDLDNYDLITDQTFEKQFGRRRKPYEHGLIGYLYLDEEPTPVNEFGDTEVGTGVDVAPGYDTAPDVASSGSGSRGGSSRHGSGRAAKIHHDAEVHKFNQKMEKRGHSSKMQRAIAIYKSNSSLPRTHVIKLIMRQLDMTRAGASSYYTKAMHAVEEEIKDKANY